MTDYSLPAWPTPAQAHAHAGDAQLLCLFLNLTDVREIFFRPKNAEKSFCLRVNVAIFFRHLASKRPICS